MKKFRYIIILLALCNYSMLFAATEQSEHQKLTEISKQIQTAQHHLKLTLAQENSLQTALKKSEETIGSLSSQIRTLDKKINQNRQRLQTLKQRVAQLQKQITAQQKQLADQARLAYQANRENYLKVLFNQQNPYLISRITTYYQYFAHAHIQEIHNINKNLKALSQTQLALTQDTENLKKLRASRVKQQQKLNVSRKKRKQVLTKIHSRIQTQNQKLSTLKTNKAELEKVLHQLRKQQAKKPFSGGNFAHMKGHLSWPTRGRIVQHFGASMNQGLRYNGVFIQAAEGQGIHAIAPGKVIFANWLKSFGLLLIVDHGNGYMTLYAHCNSLYKKVGDIVSVGEPIASVGNSGGAEKVGLSFEIRHNGTPLNPSQWCA